MDLSAIDPARLLASVMIASTPILLAALGELVAERAGVLNLGVEGMMITGAVLGFAAAYGSGSATLGFLAGAGAGAALSLVFGVLTQGLMANQVATGLALTLFGLGLSALLGQGFVGVRPPPVPRLDAPDAARPRRRALPRPRRRAPHMGLPPPHPRGPRAARRGRGARRRARAGLPRGRDPHGRHRLRRRHGGLGRRLPLARARAAVDRGDDGRRRLDRARHRGVRRLAAVARARGRLPLRRGHRAPAQPPGRGAGAPGLAVVVFTIPYHDRRTRAHIAAPGGAAPADLGRPHAPT